MKIAFVTDTYRPSVDGVVRSIDEYKIQLQQLGHEVKIFAPAPKDKRNRIREISYCESIRFLPYPQYRIPYSYSKCVQDAIEFKPDIIHSHAMLAMGLVAKKIAKRTKKPLVGTFHTLIPKAGHYISDVDGIKLWFENISWKYLQWFYSKDFDAIISPSKYMQNMVLEHWIKTCVVANPVDLKKFENVKNDVRAYSWFKKNTVLHIGRIAKEKNIDFLLKVAQEDKFDADNMQILIAGDGPYLSELRKKVKKNALDDKIFFCGRVDEQLLSSFYSLAQCTLFASKFETQGLCALESLACKTPVIALENTAIAEYLQDCKNGYVIRENPQDAINAILQTIKNKKMMGTNAYKVAQKYSVQKCTQKLLSIYEQAIEHNRIHMKNQNL